VDVQGRRDSPRNSDCKLKPLDELLSMRRELLLLRTDPDAFIAKVFRSTDKIWVDRCSSIIIDRHK
jgi:hypothetical protein